MIQRADALLAAVVYVPSLHQPFATFSLRPTDWLIVITLAFTVVPVIEVVKWAKRRGWLGDLA